MTTSRRLRILAAVAVLAALGIWAVTAWRSDTNEPRAFPSAVSGAPVDQGALDALEAQSAPPPADPTYRRDLFGPAWDDVDGNGCNQRDDVLVRDVLPGTVLVQQQGGCDHDVLAGTWVDPYTGLSIVVADAKTDGQLVPIDHLVPLVEAYKSGAKAWPPQRRVAFANDLTNLRATAQSTNQQKSGLDPSSWRPAVDQCGYARAWVATKLRWELAADPPEIAALQTMLSGC